MSSHVANLLFSPKSLVWLRTSSLGRDSLNGTNVISSHLTKIGVLSTINRRLASQINGSAFSCSRLFSSSCLSLKLSDQRLELMTLLLGDQEPRFIKYLIKASRILHRFNHRLCISVVPHCLSQQFEFLFLGSVQTLEQNEAEHSKDACLHEMVFSVISIDQSCA